MYITTCCGCENSKIMLDPTKNAKIQDLKSLPHLILLAEMALLALLAELAELSLLALLALGKIFKNKVGP